MGEEEVFDLIQVVGKPDEYKCKECEKSYPVAGSIRKHFRAKHKKKDQEINETAKSVEELLQEEDESVDDFNPDDDNAHKSTQNGDKTLSAEDIMKIYEDKENSGEEEEETTNVGEQTIFPEHEMMIKLVESTKTSEEDLNDGGTSSGERSMKAELDNLKAEIKKKDETLMEKEERILEKDIEITTLKDEIESINKTVETKSEEMDVLIASVNSLEEEKSVMKVKLMKESKTVEKQNITMKKIFKEKECLQKENLSITKATKEGDDDEKSDSMLKKKLSEKQKEITMLKERNKKLADDLAEEQANENPNNLILTNLLKTRTVEMRKIEKEKENLKKNLSETDSKLKEANDKVTKTEIKNTRLENEVNNMIEILGKKDSSVGNKPPSETREKEAQLYRPDGNPKRCSFNNKTICKNDTCSFVHSNFVCTTYSQFGKCDQGNQCPGKHPSGICNRWRDGNCHLKTEDCQFRHPEVITNENKEGEHKRKRSSESPFTSKAKNTKMDGRNENSRNDFLCESISNLHRKMDAYERKEKGYGWKEEQMQQSFNAPPVPPFTNYLPVQNFSQPSVSMVQPAAPTTTQSFQPLGTVPSHMYPANTSMWVAPQAQWTGQVRQVQGPAQSQQEGHQVPYPVGPAYNQFYQ